LDLARIQPELLPLPAPQEVIVEVELGDRTIPMARFSAWR
jgi:hypothetical protein